jgi:hypothetical protein
MVPNKTQAIHGICNEFQEKLGWKVQERYKEILGIYW